MKASVFTLVVLSSIWMSGQTEKLAVLEVRLAEVAPKEQLLGQPISLKLNEDSRAPKSFHVRVFRGTKAAQFSRHADLTGCVEFWTIVVPATADGRIHLQSFDDPGWLRNGREPEDYVFVFESGKDTTESKIRIHKSQLENYFRGAFTLRLVPPQGWGDATVSNAVQQQISDHQAQNTRRFEKLPDRPCQKLITIEPTPVEAKRKRSKQEFRQLALLSNDTCGL